jgi:hypothetical protein
MAWAMAYATIDGIATHSSVPLVWVAEIVLALRLAEEVRSNGG